MEPDSEDIQLIELRQKKKKSMLSKNKSTKSQSSARSPTRNEQSTPLRASPTIPKARLQDEAELQNEMMPLPLFPVEQHKQSVISFFKSEGEAGVG